MYLLIFFVELIFAGSRTGRRQMLLQERLVKSFLANTYPDLLDDEYPANIAETDTFRWMGVMRAELNNKPLNEIHIPGAHDAAMNIENKEHFKTQNLSIYELLMSGVRFLDLRTRISGSGQIVTYHMFSGHAAHTEYGDSISLIDVMKQIDDFLYHYPTEIVIVKIKPFILSHLISTDAENYEKLINQAMPDRLKGLTLLNDKPFIQTYGQLIANNDRFIIIFEYDKRQHDVQEGGFLFSNKDRKFMYSDPPKCGNYPKLVAALDKKLPVQSETRDKLALFHWTITGGDIFKNTNMFVSDMDDFQRKAWSFFVLGKRVNVIMMDFCSPQKSIRIIELNDPNWRVPMYPEHNL